MEQSVWLTNQWIQAHIGFLLGVRHKSYLDFSRKCKPIELKTKSKNGLSFPMCKKATKRLRRSMFKTMYVHKNIYMYICVCDLQIST